MTFQCTSTFVLLLLLLYFKTFKVHQIFKLERWHSCSVVWLVKLDKVSILKINLTFSNAEAVEMLEVPAKPFE